MTTDTATLRDRIDAASTPDELAALADELIQQVDQIQDPNHLLVFLANRITQPTSSREEVRAVRSAKIAYVRMCQAIAGGDARQSAVAAIQLTAWTAQLDATSGEDSGGVLRSLTERARDVKLQNTRDRHAAIVKKCKEFRDRCQNITAARLAVQQWADKRDEENSRLPEDSSLKAAPLNWRKRTIMTATRGMK